MIQRYAIRVLAFALAVTGPGASLSAHADIYTWVDANGNVNLSNLPPPEGTRVTRVFREDAAVRASSEAARAAARSNELTALAERVTQLESDLETAKRDPPAVAYAPPLPLVVSAPNPPVFAQAIVAPPAPVPAYAGCNDPWANCFFPGYSGFYPSGIVVLNASTPHGFDRSRRRGRDHRHPMVQVQRPAVPTPVGALPDPVNLFPGTHRR
ncbi:MAG: DUF4124 domain-containing protein [Rudaea sp.]